MIFLNVEDVIDYHTVLIDEFGGSHGIRDMGLLISAVEMARASMLSEDLHVTIFDKAAAYLFHIVCNHPFLDGNKRTGAVAALTFLASNGVELKYDSFEFEELVVSIAKGNAKKEAISNFLKSSASSF